MASVLQPGERILWVGAPSRRVWLLPADAFLIPFSLIWCGLAVFWEQQAIAGADPGFFRIFGGLFVILGLYFTIGRFFVGRWLRSRTEYVVTDRRAIAVGPRKVLFADRTAEASRRRARDGRRITIDFGAPGRQRAAGLGGNRFSAFGGRGNAITFSPLTGMDPFGLNPVPVVFDDVEDVAGLEAALAGQASSTRVA